MIQIPSQKAGFRHKHTQYGTLVVPRYSKWSWLPDERRFRSAIVRDGHIVSSGFCKFGGMEEAGFIGDAEKLKAELQSLGQLRLVEKMDGVLAIRSIIDGEVVWRTRGTADGGVHRESIERLVPDCLKDTSLLPDCSILCELTDPQWRIVLDYDTPALTLIGVVEHDTGRHWRWDECQSLAEDLQLTQPACEMWTGSWRGLIKNVTGRVGTEGIVAQSADGQTMLKLKTESYCSLHRIRFVHQGQLLVELWERSRWESVEDAHRWLRERGVDIEHIPHLKERVEALCQTAIAADETVAHLDVELLKLQMAGANARATMREQLPQPQWDVLDLLLDGRVGAAADKCQKAHVEALLATWDTVDDAAFSTV